MTPPREPSLRSRVILGARQYGISTVLFRTLVAGKLGLNVSDLECLALLFHGGIASPTQLARHTGLSSGATTAMLDRLEKGGLITRRRNPRDRRGILIVLVKSGADQVGPWFTPIRRAQDRLVASYSDKELRLLLDFFERSEAMWERERAQLRETLQGG